MVQSAQLQGLIQGGAVQEIPPRTRDQTQTGGGSGGRVEVRVGGGGGGRRRGGVVLVVVRGGVRVVGGLRRVLTQGGVVEAAVRVGQRGVRGGGRGVSEGVVVALGVQVGGVTPDVVPVSLQEAQLGVVQDVEVRAAQAVACGADEEVAVMFPGLPPHREVEGGAAQLEAGGEEGVTENLRGRGQIRESQSGNTSTGVRPRKQTEQKVNQNFRSFL